ncbi:hypothetical protein GQ53DRAFT_831947 [Thozetella sp. PMI_491]|nr:hypothetical protein GQ53DRAFT_831947 [Thozetella sp. PMI_491]
MVHMTAAASYIMNRRYKKPKTEDGDNKSDVDDVTPPRHFALVRWIAAKMTICVNRDVRVTAAKAPALAPLLSIAAGFMAFVHFTSKIVFRFGASVLACRLILIVEMSGLASSLEGEVQDQDRSKYSPLSKRGQRGIDGGTGLNSTSYTLRVFRMKSHTAGYLEHFS